MRLSWSVLLVGAIASSIPLGSSHEVHLSYLPTSQPVPSVESYLSVEWSMRDGKLFANGDLVFPPSMSMQVHAPRYEGAQKTRIDSETLYYSLEVRPLSSHEVGAPHGIVRVDVDFMDREGHSVTPNTVVLDLLDHPDGNPRITKIRIEPGKSREVQSEHKWQMKFWQTEMGALFKQTETKATKLSRVEASVQSEPTKSAKSDVANPKTSSVVESTVGYIFSPYFAPSSYSHRTNRHSHGHHDHTFMRLMRPVVLPALLGAVAGLLACLLGFLVGHVIMSVSYRLGLRKHPRHHRRSRTTHVEDGIVSEKAGLLPEIYVTESEV
ncbi:hypothetical protein N7451_006100 [Penicillium sp. IBT 35674x]|nr:hypothetical protein N7451_006100 [Penicillium sp. IBT 35674x]